MNETALVIVMLVAAFAGAAVGTYLAWQPAVKSAQDAIARTQEQAAQAFERTEQNIAKATEHLAALEIVVPEPRVSINFQWWHVFAVTLAVVLGMTLSRAYDRSAMRKIVNAAFAKIIKLAKPKRQKRMRRTSNGTQDRQGRTDYFVPPRTHRK